MNFSIDTTAPAPAATDELSALIGRATSIVAQIHASSDDEELADLVADLNVTNDRIVGAPVATLEQVQAKCEHLLSMIESGDDQIGSGDDESNALTTLLRSLVGRAA